MKIAYLSTFYPYRGGIAQFNALLYNTLAQNHDVKAYTFSRQYPDILFPGQSQYVTENDKADRIPAVRILDSINPLSYLKTGNLINKFAPDITITKFWMPFFGPSLGKVCKSLKKNGVRNISILDNVIPHEKRPVDMVFIRYFLKQNHGFIVMSKTVEHDLLSLKPDAQYRLSPHPLYSHFGANIPKHDARKILGIPQDKKILLFFGFIRSYKGLDVLIETLSLLPEDYFLLIAGESYGSFKPYDQLIEKLNLGSRLQKHVRYISDDETPVFFSAADVCVLPYKSATQSGIVGIAYHFDLPVIATDKGGLAEMIIPYNTGIIAPEAEPEVLKQSIMKYFEGDTAERLSHNVEQYKKIASWEKLAGTILELYATLKPSKG